MGKLYDPLNGTSPTMDERVAHFKQQGFRKGSRAVCRFPDQYGGQFTFGKVYKVSAIERPSWLHVEKDDNGRGNGWSSYHFVNLNRLTDLEKAIYGF